MGRLRGARRGRLIAESGRLAARGAAPSLRSGVLFGGRGDYTRHVLVRMPGSALFWEGAIAPLGLRECFAAQDPGADSPG